MRFNLIYFTVQNLILTPDFFCWHLYSITLQRRPNIFNWNRCRQFDWINLLFFDVHQSFVAHFAFDLIVWTENLGHQWYLRKNFVVNWLWFEFFLFTVVLFVILIIILGDSDLLFNWFWSILQLSLLLIELLLHFCDVSLLFLKRCSQLQILQLLFQ